MGTQEDGTVKSHRQLRSDSDVGCFILHFWFFQQSTFCFETGSLLGLEITN